jgi:diguanylate cyclase (GGDEF)-like protein/putative nucleotidyltransferase with HDIG domain
VGQSVRADLFHGTLYGLALSAVLWTMVLSPPSGEPAAVLLLAVSSSTGLFDGRSRSLGRYSPTYAFVLAGLVLFGPGTALLAGFVATVSRHCLGRAGLHGARIRHIGFESAALAIAATAAAAAWSFPARLPAGAWSWFQSAAPVARHAVAYVLALAVVERVAFGLATRGRTGRSRLRGVFRRLARATIGATVGSGLVWLFERPDLRAGGIALALLLSGYAVHASRQARRRLAHRHDLRTTAVCNSVVQALARLLQSKDSGTRDHVRRVQRLCLEIAARLRVSTPEMEALSAAALLHDIGKIAVPDGILTKPGRLTTSEMERMRVHPEVGAELLESIPFPYPVAPIVRHHHERWDGRGYPSGLKAEEIPRGARILAAVDSYDALISDRPYRKAIRGEDAVDFLERESGQAFDPEVIAVLLEHLESSAVDIAATSSIPSKSLEREADGDGEIDTPRGSLPRAQQELRVLYEICRAGSYDLTFDEYITLVACKLGPLIPYRSLVVYFVDPTESLLRARFAIGEGADKLGLMTIPVGERISGWASKQERACIGNDHLSPLDRDGTRSDLEDWAEDPVVGDLSATLAAPINVGGVNLGVLTLYDGPKRRFTPDERRLLVRVAGHVGLVSRRVRQRSQEGDGTLTDPLTGVPNARFLWLETGHRISQTTDASTGFGLLAFRIAGMEQIGERLGHDETDRLLCQLARRFVASCAENETLVRFGENLFIVLTPRLRGGELVRRWHEIAEDVEEPALAASDGGQCKVRLTAAHANYPEDGEELEALLETLDARLGLADRPGRSVLPFRPHSRLAEFRGRVRRRQP